MVSFLDKVLKKVERGRWMIEKVSGVRGIWEERIDI